MFHDRVMKRQFLQDGWLLQVLRFPNVWEFRVFWKFQCFEKQNEGERKETRLALLILFIFTWNTLDYYVCESLHVLYDIFYIYVFHAIRSNKTRRVFL